MTDKERQQRDARHAEECRRLQELGHKAVSDNAGAATQFTIGLVMLALALAFMKYMAS